MYIEGNAENHNCIKCKNNFSVEIRHNDYLNCFQECKYFNYFDDKNNYHCIPDSFCPKEYPKLSKDNKQCIKNDLKNLKEDLNIKEKDEIEKMSKEEQINYYDNLLKLIENAFKENYDTSILDSGEDEYIPLKKIIITFTTTENQKKNINNNTTSIYLGQCESLLRSHYNLSENVTFYMEKIDVIQDGYQIPKIEFNLYYKLNDSNLENLNLSICDTSKIIFSIPTKLSDDIDKLNSSSEYYNNKCYSAKSESGTDIIIKDRQKEFVDNNKTICQENCDFSEYNDEEERANCSCYVEESIGSFANMNINKTKLYKNFKDSKDKIEFSNLAITSCDVLGIKDNIKSNAGFFSLIIILGIFIIIFIIFCSKGYT